MIEPGNPMQFNASPAPRADLPEADASVTLRDNSPRVALRTAIDQFERLLVQDYSVHDPFDWLTAVVRAFEEVCLQWRRFVDPGASAHALRILSPKTLRSNRLTPMRSLSASCAMALADYRARIDILQQDLTDRPVFETEIEYGCFKLVDKGMALVIELRRSEQSTRGTIPGHPSTLVN